MAQWSERYKTHPIWQTLQDLGPAIDKAFNREGIDTVSLDILDRLKSVLTFVGRRLAGSDPYLIQIESFGTLNNALVAINQEVNNFITNGDVSHLSKANTSGDSVLTYLSQINVQLTTEDFLAAKEAAESYRLGLETAHKAVTEKAKNLADELTAQSKQLAGNITSLQAQLTNLSDELTAERAKLTKVVSDYQNQFSQAQELRSTTFATSEKERQDRFSILFNDYTQKLSDQNAEFTKQREDLARSHLSALDELKNQSIVKSSKLHEDMLKHRADIEKLVGVIGNLGVTSGYLKTANHTRRMVWVWQIITVGAMGGLIYIGFNKFIPLAEKATDFTWPAFAIRVFVALSVGALAAYAGTQADKYQKSERYNRRLALELEAIGPYIAPLDEDKQKDFRIKIGERTFGQGEETHSKFDTKSPTNFLDALADPEKKSILVGLLDLLRFK